MNTPHLSRIWVFPIKSLDGVAVPHATMLSSGPIAYDREFAIIDEHGQRVNGKRTADIHRIRSEFDLEQRTVTLWTEGATEKHSFHLDGDRTQLEYWLSDYFGYRVTLQHDPHMGFPDDAIASGPTVVSVATLETVASWFDQSLDETRRRFRANLEIADVFPFWEDELFDATGQPIQLHLGDVVLTSSNLCQRCIVPTRNPTTGESFPGFQKQFNQQRQATLPKGAIASQFNHFYKLTLNTKSLPSNAGKAIHVGDLVQQID